MMGPPCAGKSTFASRFVLEHSDWTYVSIDQFRTEYGDVSELQRGERLAWEKLTTAVHQSSKVILETSGYSWRLARVLKDKNVFQVLFTGDPEIFHERLRGRSQRVTPYPSSRSEHDSIDWCIRNQSLLTPDKIIMTDQTPFEEWYLDLSTEILFRKLRR